jgi:acyl-CoA synthetase (AMP-forming)/AMP-acid ligase II
LQAAASAAGSSLATVSPDAGRTPHAPAPPPHSTQPDADTECALLYTSGTTGRPKGCVLPNEYYVFAGAWYNGIGGLCTLREGQERLITPLPMVHMNAMAYSTMAMILSGGCILPLDRFHPGSWWECVRESCATIVHYLGVMPAMLMGKPAAYADRQHEVRFGFGAGVEKALHGPFEERFGFPLLEAWAMTETGAGAVIIANREPRHVGSSCFGRPEPEVEVRVVDEAGNDLPPGQQGELLVRTAGERPRFGFFREYVKEPEATAEAWAGGWFHTGDIVRADVDGYLYFVDRRKNVIRRSGENISAVEVEGVLRQHPLVANVGVAPVPDPVRGDEVMACVVPNMQIPADQLRPAAEQLVRHCLERLAYYKAPGYVAFCETLPLTATQKIQRGDLRQLASASMEGRACIDTRTMKKRQA